MSKARDSWLSPAPSHFCLIPFLSLLLLYLLAPSCAAPVKGGKLLVVYIDAMRWDYIKRRLDSPYKFPNENKASAQALLQVPSNGLFLMKRFGSYVKRVRPVFPTQCLPNIMSAFTGLYPRHHGMLGNEMYDAKSGFHFNYRKQTDHLTHFMAAPSHWWESTEPLWDSLEKRHGGRSSIYNVPTAFELREARRKNGTGGRAAKSKRAAEGRGGAGSLFHSYQRDLTWAHFENNLMDAVRRLRRNLTDFAVVYSDVLDSEGHLYGPLSAKVDSVMTKLDEVLHTTLREIFSAPEANIHLMLLSDHGMQGISENLSVYIDDCILKSNIKKMVNDGTIVGIWPDEDREEEVYERLNSCSEVRKGFKVFMANDPTLQRYLGHDPTDPRMPPVVVMASPGYVIITEDFNFPRYDVHGTYPQGGLHGYDPNEEHMHTAMMITGPQIRGGFEMSDMNITEVYQLMCHLLGVTPQPHNGTFANIEPMLRSRRHFAAPTPVVSKLVGASSGHFLHPTSLSIVVPILLAILECYLTNFRGTLLNSVH